MSLELCCCLCCSPCGEYVPLQNDSGECNEIYEITVKYFDPMLITDYVNSKCLKDKVLCQDCWLHIKDFHDFHQTVINSRLLLEEIEDDVSHTQVQITLQEKSPTCMSEKESIEDNDEFSLFEDVIIKADPSDEEDTLKSDFNISEENLVESDVEEEDDEKHLIELKTPSSTEDEIVEERPKVCRVQNTKDTSKHIEAETCNIKEVNLEIKKNPSRRKEKRNPYIGCGKEKSRESNEFIAKWKPQLECDLCKETFPDFDLLKRHFKGNHNTRFYVKCCERKFYRRCVFVEHIHFHVNPEAHKCDICGKTSTSKSNLKLHKQAVHEGTARFKCEVCHKSFNQKPVLERHRLTHVTGSKDFICKECGKGFVHEVQLKSHINSVHNSEKHVCDQCGKTLYCKAALNIHLRKHAGIERPKYPCDVCGAQLISRRNLNRHKKISHNDSSTIYVCSICGKVAASEYYLLSHKKLVHLEEPKHKCVLCGKAFKRAKYLREHIATHTGEDLYQCPHCPQTFKVSSKMHHHRKKAHPIEYEKGRKNRPQVRKVDLSTQETSEFVIL